MTPTEQIQQLKKEALAKIKEAEDIAEEHGLTFSFGVAYGMGGTYFSKKAIKVEYDEIPYALREQGDEYGWMPSSSGC